MLGNKKKKKKKREKKKNDSDDVVYIIYSSLNIDLFIYYSVFLGRPSHTPTPPQPIRSRPKKKSPSDPSVRQSIPKLIISTSISTPFAAALS